MSGIIDGVQSALSAYFGHPTVLRVWTGETRVGREVLPTYSDTPVKVRELIAHQRLGGLSQAVAETRRFALSGSVVSAVPDKSLLRVDGADLPILDSQAHRGRGGVVTRWVLSVPVSA